MPILSSLGHISRLTRAAFVFAREGAFVGVDPVPLPPVLRPPLALGKLDRQTRRRWPGRLVPGDRSIGAVLREAWAVPFNAPGHRRRQGRHRARTPAGSRRADEPRNGGRHRRGFFRREDRVACSRASASRSRRLRSPRSIALRCKPAKACGRSRSKCCAPGPSGALGATSRTWRSQRGSPRAWRLSSAA